MQKFYDAYAFTCDRSLHELLTYLNANTEWRWLERDSENFDYISSLVKKDYAMLKIYDEGNGRFVLDIRYDAKGKDPDEEWEQFSSMLLDEFLPSIGARDVEQDDGYA